MTGHPSVLLRPSGPLDAEACNTLRQQLASAFAVGVSSIVVDLSAVTECDVAGLQVLAGASRHLRRSGGLLVVVHASEDLARSLRINGLSELLEVPASRSLSVVTGFAESTPRPASRALAVVRPNAQTPA